MERSLRNEVAKLGNDGESAQLLCSQSKLLIPSRVQPRAMHRQDVFVTILPLSDEECANTEMSALP
jgi:hypothetical protein